MQNIRESSQQDRRVYVGNLSYDVKWHHLKDFMRQGMEASLKIFSLPSLIPCSRRGLVRRRAAASEWNVKGKLKWWLVFEAWMVIDGCSFGIGLWHRGVCIAGAGAERRGDAQ